MRKAYVFRLYPTSKQADQLNSMLRDHCELYNAALEERREAWRKRTVGVRAAEQMAQLTDMRAARPDQAVWSFTSQQQTIRRLDKAFRAFFRRIKAGEPAGYPRFRSVRRFDSVDFRHGDGIKFDKANHLPTRAALRVQGVGTIAVRMHRSLPDGARIGHVTVKRDGQGRRARWHVVLPIEVATAPSPSTGRAVGIDLGVAHLLTASEAIPGLTDEQGHAANPRHGRASSERVAAIQSTLDRCQPKSRRREKAREQLSAVCGKVRRRRLDCARKAAAALARHADVLVLEDLNPARMLRRPKPRSNDKGSYLPNGAAAKSGLNKSIQDAGWGVLLRCVLNKAEEAGREVVLVNPANTSRRCAQCGHTCKENRVTQAKFRCVACGHVDHADRNAALNILRAGTAHRDAQPA